MACDECSWCSGTVRSRRRTSIVAPRSPPPRILRAKHYLLLRVIYTSHCYHLPLLFYFHEVFETLGILKYGEIDITFYVYSFIITGYVTRFDFIERLMYMK